MSHGKMQLLGGNPSSDRWLVSTAIGGDYLATWMRTTKPLWDAYAEQHDLGIAIATEDLFREGEPALNGSWQKMLAPRELREALGRDVRCALVDTDLLISPRAREIFTVVEPRRIGVVSQERGLPLEVAQLRRRIAFLRRTLVDPDYPLVSILNATPRQIFEWAELEPSDDYFCAGLLVIDTESHGERLADWYRSAPQNDAYHAIGAWEEVWLNRCVQSSGDIAWLDYSWHALWIYEVAALYPFLYDAACPPTVARWCLAASLMRNDFVHLAGRWESGLLAGGGPALPGAREFAAFASLLGQHEEMSAPALMRGTLLPPLRSP